MGRLLRLLVLYDKSRKEHQTRGFAIFLLSLHQIFRYGYFASDIIGYSSGTYGVFAGVEQWAFAVGKRTFRYQFGPGE